MRGLIISILIMLVLIAIGIVASMMLTSNLNSKTAAAQGSGIEAGRVQIARQVDEGEVWVYHNGHSGFLVGIEDAFLKRA